VDKFNRNYYLLIEEASKSGTYINIRPPFSLEFDIQRNDLSSVNVASFRIYNLSEKRRDNIFKDQWNYSGPRLIIFAAGYGKDTSLVQQVDINRLGLPVIFKGIMDRAWSVREGVDFITQVESYDGGQGYTQVSDKENIQKNIQFKSGTSCQEIIEQLMRSLEPYGIAFGAIGDFSSLGNISKGVSYNGSIIGNINEMTGNCFFIDQQKSYCLKDTEQLGTKTLPVLNITSESGLIGTPIKQQTKITLEMIFEPSANMLQQVNLDTQTFKKLNGSYKIVSVQHKGMISEVVCGSATTSLGLYGLGQLESVEGIRVIR